MATSAPPTAGQFLRYSSLTVSSSDATNNSILALSSSDLPAQAGSATSGGGLRFKFEVRASDVATPNTMSVRIYNLADSTRQTILSEYDRVTLTAGYQNGNKGIIFSGDIKRYGFGRERNVDSYLQIDAGDGDKPYTSASIAQSFPNTTSDSDLLKAYAAASNLPIATGADGFLEAGGTRVNPRGQVSFGLTRGFIDELAASSGARWSIQNGALTLVPNTGYLPGQIVEVNTATGMIGTPEATEQGVVVRCYLNPLIHIGRLIRISASDINRYKVLNPINYPSVGSSFYPATVTAEGTYRVLVVTHQGDTRGNDWISELTCLAVDISSPASSSVAAG
jgi:hypothetical protein